MAVTLRDIAKALNLSHATVSFVLNDRRDVAIPQATRDRVLETARAMGYRPNRAARALVSGKTQMAAIWTPSIAQPRAHRAFLAANAALQARGYGTLYVEDGPSSPYDWPVDGVIAYETCEPQSSSPTIPTVCVGANVDERVDHIRFDPFPAIRSAVAHLVASGARAIAYRGPEDEMARAVREIFEADGVPQSGDAEAILTIEGEGSRITLPIEEACAAAVRMMMERINEPDLPVRSLTLPARFEPAA